LGAEEMKGVDTPPHNLTQCPRFVDVSHRATTKKKKPPRCELLSRRGSDGALTTKNCQNLLRDQRFLTPCSPFSHPLEVTTIKRQLQFPQVTRNTDWRQAAGPVFAWSSSDRRVLPRAENPPRLLSGSREAKSTDAASLPGWTHFCFT